MAAKGVVAAPDLPPAVERFAEVKAVTLVSPDEAKTREVAIESMREHQGRALVKFAGIESPEELRELHLLTAKPFLYVFNVDEAVLVDEAFLNELRALVAAAEAMGVARTRLLHVAQSLFHDHVPAKAIGLSTAWIDRRGDLEGSGATRQPDGEVRPDFTFPTLAALAAAASVAAN